MALAGPFCRSVQSLDGEHVVDALVELELGHTTGLVSMSWGKVQEPGDSSLIFLDRAAATLDVGLGLEHGLDGLLVDADSQ